MTGPHLTKIPPFGECDHVGEFTECPFCALDAADTVIAAAERMAARIDCPEYLREALRAYRLRGGDA